jgi:hypothetical protein
VEELEFCLFFVVFPARCISSISPRFYFGKHAFCFLPLVTILESSRSSFLKFKTNNGILFSNINKWLINIRWKLEVLWNWWNYYK